MSNIRPASTSNSTAHHWCSARWTDFLFSLHLRISQIPCWWLGVLLSVVHVRGWLALIAGSQCACAQTCPALCTPLQADPRYCPTWACHRLRRNALLCATWHQQMSGMCAVKGCKNRYRQNLRMACCAMPCSTLVLSVWKCAAASADTPIAVCTAHHDQ